MHAIYICIFVQHTVTDCVRAAKFHCTAVDLQAWQLYPLWLGLAYNALSAALPISLIPISSQNMAAAVGSELKSANKAVKLLDLASKTYHDHTNETVSDAPDKQPTTVGSF